MRSWRGIDIATPTVTPVLGLPDGVVRKADPDPSRMDPLVQPGITARVAWGSHSGGGEFDQTNFFRLSGWAT